MDVAGIADRQTAIRTVGVAYLNQVCAVDEAKRRVGLCEDNIEIAQRELESAWDAAGGVCPLCGSPIDKAVTV